MFFQFSVWGYTEYILRSGINQQATSTGKEVEKGEL